MLNSITVNFKFHEKQDAIDFLDILLLYSEINLMLDTVSLANILRLLGVEVLNILTKEHRIKIYFKENVYGPGMVGSDELFLSTYTSRSTSVDSILYQYNRQFFNNSITNLKFVSQYQDIFSNYRYPIDFTDAITSDLVDYKRFNRYFSLYTESKAPKLLQNVPVELAFIPSGNSFIEQSLYRIEFNGDKESFYKHYKAAVGYEFSISDFLLKYGESKGDFLMSSAFNSEISNPISLAIFKEMSSDLLSRNQFSKYQIESFNDYVLEGLYSPGEAYLNKVIGVDTLMKIYEATAKFRDHLRMLDNSKSVLGEYNQLLQKDYAIKHKSNKVVRFVATNVIAKFGEYVIKSIVPPIAVDAIQNISSYALSAFDTFLYDKLKKGWRPNGMLIDFEEGVKPKLKI